MSIYLIVNRSFNVIDFTQALLNLNIRSQLLLVLTKFCVMFKNSSQTLIGGNELVFLIKVRPCAALEKFSS